MKLRKDQFGINGKPVGRFAGPFHLTNDQPLLRFEGEDRDQGVTFWIGDHPAGKVWHTGHPTSLYYYQLSGAQTSVLPPHLKKWEKLVQTRPPEELSLEVLFEPFKTLLPSGEYWLVYKYPQKSKVPANYQAMEPLEFILRPETIPNQDTTEPPTAYFELPNFFETRDADSLDQDRIEHYKETVKKGQSPVIVCYCQYEKYRYGEFGEYPPIDDIIAEASPYFILDGHHKARAYEALNNAARENGKRGRRVPGILHIARLI